MILPHHKLWLRTEFSQMTIKAKEKLLPLFKSQIKYLSINPEITQNAVSYKLFKELVGESEVDLVYTSDTLEGPPTGKFEIIRKPDGTTEFESGHLVTEDYLRYY